MGVMRMALASFSTTKLMPMELGGSRGRGRGGNVFIISLRHSIRTFDRDLLPDDRCPVVAAKASNPPES